MMIPTPIRFAAAGVALAACLAGAVQAEVRLPRLFGDDMVLQRDKPVPVWGWAAPGETVSVRFGGQERKATAGADGKWLVRLDPMPASDAARELAVSGANTVTLRRVLVGDVWLCSGDFGVYWEMYAGADSARAASQANDPQLRLLKVVSRSSNTPVDDIDGAWRPCTPEAVAGFSALAYYFGKDLQAQLKVPIGLIDASYRYSVARGWMPPEAFRRIPELKTPRDRMDSWDPATPVGKAAFAATLDAVEKWLPQAEQAFRDGKPIARQPVFPAPLPANDSNYLSIGELSLHYQGMIHPLTRFPVRGVVWSLGESGCLEVDKYRHYLRGLIEGWRQGWGDEKLPFYIELLPAMGKPPESPPAIDFWTRMREEQLACLSIPDTGMAVTFDVADYVAENRNRQDPAHRLALAALAKAYGQKVVHSGPMYKSHRIDGGRVVVSFDSIGAGLMAGEKAGLEPVRQAKGAGLKGFALAGADKQWHWADARIEGDTVVLQSDKVPAPVAVRYACMANPSGCNLYNRDGLPAAPFRTDNW